MTGMTSARHGGNSAIHAGYRRPAVPVTPLRCDGTRATESVAVDYLYSLYDALVSIHVPSEKARAVVDAMERDMGTTLATKQDLKLLEHQLAGMRTELRQEIENRTTLLSRDVDGLRKDMEKEFALVRKEMEALRLSMTVRLGSMLAVGVGVTISVVLGVLRLWL
jgi:hypothetical protein